MSETDETTAQTIDGLRRALARAEVLNRVLLAASQMLAPRQLLQLVCEETARAIGVPQSGIALLDDDRTQLTVTAYYSERGSSPVGTKFALTDNAINLAVVGQGQPIVVEDVQTDERMVAVREILRPLGAISLLVVPIWSGGEVIGTLGLDAFERRTFAEDEIALVEQIASAVSGGLTVARLYSAAQEELERRRQAEQIIGIQEETLRKISTPLLQLSADTVLLPLVGALDERRITQIIETLLTGVQQTGARVAILDITGVGLIDTQIAGVLLSAAQGIRLLGARAILTGIRPEVAQTLVSLGVDLRDLTTCGTLQQGIALALSRR